MVSLREVEAPDSDQMRIWRNLPEIRENMFTDHVISAEEHDRWFEKMRHDPSCVYWIVRSDDRDVGVAHLYNIDPQHGRCFWGFYLAISGGPGPWLGTVVEYLVVRFVFEELKLRKLCGEVLADNQPVVRMHTRFGFQQEGLLRQHVVKSGVPHDVVLLALLAEEWQARRAGLEEMLRSRGLL